MNLDFIDPDDLQLSTEELNSIIDEINGESEAEFTAFGQWWETSEMPQGLQCIEIHMRASFKAWIDELLAARGKDVNDKKLRVKVALTIDSMIS